MIDAEGRERAIHRVPYGTVLMFEDGAKVKEGERLAEWDPFTLPIITEQSGMVRYQDLVDGKTMDERSTRPPASPSAWSPRYRATGRTKKEDLRPRLTLLGERRGPKGEETEAARYMLAPGTALSVEDGQHVEAGDILARASREAAKTRDITGGLPRVAELFEARMPKDVAIIAKISGPDRVRPRLQGQAQDRDRPGRGRSGRVPDPQDARSSTSRKATSSRRATR